MNDQIIFAIKTGVISGIFTAATLWIIRQLILKVVSPKLEQYFYKGVILDGTWNAVVKNKSFNQVIKVVNVDQSITNHPVQQQEKNLTINLRQKGTKITGTFYAKTETKKIQDNKEKIEKEYANQYKLEGHVADNFIILNYKALSRNRTGLGSLVLQITHGGTKLRGGISFIGEGGEYIQTINEVIFERSI